MRSSGQVEYANETLYVGCAGWSVPKEGANSDTIGNVRHDIATGRSIVADGIETPKEKRKSHLERYAAFFSAVEINSSFYRPHLPSTYARWRDTVPPEFRFSVKMPRTVTHDLRLKNCSVEVGKFLEGVGNLGRKLGCLLIQLPPSLGFDARIAGDFFALIRSSTDVPLALEPRHPAWFEPDTLRLLEQREVALVHADPSPTEVPAQGLPQTASMAYFRLHGSPSMYHSSYDRLYLDELMQEIVRQRKQGQQVWCIFDNTASGAAFPNALTMSAMWQQRLQRK